MLATTIEIELKTNDNLVNAVNNHKFIIPSNKKYPLVEKITSILESQFTTCSIEHYQTQLSIRIMPKDQSIKKLF